MELCETCVHWGAPDQVEKALPVRKCQAIPHDKHGASDWDAEDLEWREECGAIYPEDRRMMEAIAVTCDGSGYRADLRTRASFGCILHSPAPKGGA